MFVLLLSLTCQGRGKDVFYEYTTNAIMKVVIAAGTPAKEGLLVISVAVSSASISAACVDR